MKTRALNSQEKEYKKIYDLMSKTPAYQDRNDILKYMLEARKYIALRVAEELCGIVDAVIREAKGGNVMAFVALMDRAYGKPAQTEMPKGGDNNPIIFMPLELIQKHALQNEQSNGVINKTLQISASVANDKEKTE